MADMAEELIEDLREQYKAMPKTRRGRHCISNRTLVGEEHPLPDPTYRVVQENRKRANIALQEESRRERNRGQEKRKRSNAVPENQDS